MLKTLGQILKISFIKLGLGLLSLLPLSNFSSAKAMAVLDKFNLLQTSAIAKTAMDTFNMTTQVNGQMMRMNMAMGSAVGPLQGGFEGACRTALLLAGGCIDNPLNAFKNLFLGLGKISPSFNFCDLVGGQKAYTSLLFIPFEEWGQVPLTVERRDGLVRTRHQMVQQSVANTLAVVAQQRQEIDKRQQKIAEKVGKGINCTDMVQGLRSIVEVLGLIAQDVVYLRLLQLQQTEIQATTAAHTVPLY